MLVAKSDLSLSLNSFKIAPESNPLEEMGSIEDLAAEMCTVSLALDSHRMYIIVIDAPPAEYEVEARNLASSDSIGLEIINAVREWHHRHSGNRKKGSNSGHVLCADGSAVGGQGKGGSRGNTKGGRR